MQVVILVIIGPYVYHLDVIVAAMQCNANKYKVSSTYYYKVYWYIKPLQYALWTSESI